MIHPRQGLCVSCSVTHFSGPCVHTQLSNYMIIVVQINVCTCGLGKPVLVVPVST